MFYSSKFQYVLSCQTVKLVIDKKKKEKKIALPDGLISSTVNNETTTCLN